MNNFTPADLFVLQSDIALSQFKFLCYGQEVGESGTPHLQGYFEVASQKSIQQAQNWLQRIVGIVTNVHLEVAKGTQEQNIAYCSKECGDTFVEYGERAKGQGKRTDLDDCVDVIKRGGGMKEIAEECPKAYIKYSQGISRLLEATSTRRKEKNIGVLVFWPNWDRQEFRSVESFSGSVFEGCEQQMVGRLERQRTCDHGRFSPDCGDSVQSTASFDGLLSTLCGGEGWNSPVLSQGDSSHLQCQSPRGVWELGLDIARTAESAGEEDRVLGSLFTGFEEGGVVGPEGARGNEPRNGESIVINCCDDQNNSCCNGWDINFPKCPLG